MRAEIGGTEELRKPPAPRRAPDHQEQTRMHDAIAPCLRPGARLERTPSSAQLRTQGQLPLLERRASHAGTFEGSGSTRPSAHSRSRETLGTFSARDVRENCPVISLGTSTHAHQQLPVGRAQQVFHQCACARTELDELHAIPQCIKASSLAIQNTRANLDCGGRSHRLPFMDTPYGCACVKR